MTECVSSADNRMEYECAPILAPLFLDQVSEPERINEITCYLDADGGVISNEKLPVFMTEHAALVGLDYFLQTVQSSPSVYAKHAEIIRDTLTFIGKKEYDAAIKGIARRWMNLLDRDQRLLLHVASDGLASDPCYAGMAKSSDYLLAGILSTFSEQEWVKYGERIFLEGPYDATDNGYRVRTILLDDWTISGAQISDAYNTLIARYPEAEGTVEVQLIVAHPDKIQHGFEVLCSGALSTTRYLPVYAYYQARPSEIAHTGAHITGFHSSVDFDFENILRAMAKDMSRLTGESVPMPPLTNIVRPYRSGYR